jgi:hypothetical protein
MTGSALYASQILALAVWLTCVGMGLTGLTVGWPKLRERKAEPPAVQATLIDPSRLYWFPIQCRHRLRSNLRNPQICRTCRHFLRCPPLWKKWRRPHLSRRRKQRCRRPHPHVKRRSVPPRLLARPPCRTSPWGRGKAGSRRQPIRTMLCPTDRREQCISSCWSAPKDRC